MSHTFPTSSSQAISVSATHQNGAGTKANSFYHVTAATHASIDQDFRPSLNRVYNLRQHAESCGRRIQLASAVIRHYNCGCALINCTLRVLARENTFHDQGTVPKLTDPTQIIPGNGCSSQRCIDID